MTQIMDNRTRTLRLFWNQVDAESVLGAVRAGADPDWADENEIWEPSTLPNSSVDWLPEEPVNSRSRDSIFAQQLE